MPEKTKSPVQLLTDYYLAAKGIDDMPKEFYQENNISYPRICKSAKQILELCDGDVTKAYLVIDITKKWADDRGLEWTIETCVKKYLDLLSKK